MQAFSRSFDHKHLSVCILLAYLLSSQFRTPPRRFSNKGKEGLKDVQCTEIASTVNLRRQNPQPLLLLPDIFTFQNGIVQVNFCLSKDYIAKFFPQDSKPVTVIHPIEDH